MTQSVDAPELLPCPFCGGEAQRITLGPDDGPDNEGGDVIVCARCQASSHVEFGRKENLVDRWNTRAASTPLLEALEKTRQLVADCAPSGFTNHDAVMALYENNAALTALISSAKGEGQ
jgi:Lar family restriction alleviation protein